MNRHASPLRLVNGIAIVIGSLAVAGIGWIVLWRLAENLHKNPEFEQEIGLAALLMIQQRHWLPILVLPSIACGCALLRRNRSRASSWFLFLATSLWLFALFGLILYCVVMFLAPLYEYKPI